MARPRPLISEPAAVLGVLAVASTVGRPLLEFQNPTGHDAPYAMPRFVEFWRNLTEGTLVPRWAPDLSLGYGEPLFNFTPPLFYYGVAAAHALGTGFAAAASLTALALLLLAAIAMYLLGREAFGVAGGLLAAVAYVVAPYFLVNLYVRYAMGDFAALAFAPLAGWGLLRTARGDRHPGPIVLGAAVGLLTLSSNHVALMTLPVLGLLAVLAAVARRSSAVLVRAAAALGVGLGASAFYWLPALAERGYVDIGFAVKGALEYRYHFVYPQQLVYSPWGYGGSVAGPEDGLSLSLGWAQLLVAALGGTVLAGRLARRADPEAPSQAALAAAGLLALLVAVFFATEVSLPVWQRAELLHLLQFPWRFLALGTVAVGFLCGSLGPALGQGWRARAGLAAGAAMLLAFGLPNAHFGADPDPIPEDLQPRAVAEWRLVGTASNEFIPIWARERPTEPAREPVTVITGVAQWEALKLAATRQVFRVVAETPSRLRFHTHYFPGWRGEVNGAETTLDVDERLGRMEVEVGPGPSQIALVFGDTPVRAWAGRLSMLSVALLAAWLLAAAGSAWRRGRASRPAPPAWPPQGTGP